MIRYGLSTCYWDKGSRNVFGFGEWGHPTVGHDWCLDNGSFNRATGFFKYRPSRKNSAKVVDELATLLTSGRLNSESRKLIASAFDEAVTQKNSAAGLRLAQQLITTTPEFHTTNVVKPTGKSLPPMPPKRASDKEYKAIIFLMLAGGVDSFNMLVPLECQNRKGGDTGAYTHYAEVRNPAHLLPENLIPIDGNDHANCDTFGVHEELPIVQELYQGGDLLFFANTGVLGKPSTKRTYRTNTPAQLFAHNTMQFETRAVDLFDHAAGTGVLGRLTDALGNYGISTASVSLDGPSTALAGASGVSPSPYVVSQFGIHEFMPVEASTMNRADMMKAINYLNNATTGDSGSMAKTWSSSLIQSLHQNRQLHLALEGEEISSDFEDTELGRKFQIVSSLIKARRSRGSDTDIFYVELGGFDTHSDLDRSLKERFSIVNSGVRSLVNTLKDMDVWDNVVLLQASEFGRTLIPDSGAGTDHAWGGHYFMCSGSVKGGHILGKYPTDMSETSEINIGRGRLIPTTSWDQIWPGIAQWTGVKEARDFDNICPNRGNFDSVFTASDFFEDVKRKPIPDPELPGETPSTDASKSEFISATSIFCNTILLWSGFLLMNFM